MKKNTKIALVVGAFWVFVVGCIVLVVDNPEVATFFCGGTFVLFAVFVVSAVIIKFLVDIWK